MAGWASCAITVPKTFYHQDKWFARQGLTELLAGITTEEKKNNADTIRWLRMYHLLSLNAAEGIPTPRRPADEDLLSWTLSGGCCYVQPSTHNLLR